MCFPIQDKPEKTVEIIKRCVLIRPSATFIPRLRSE